MGFSTATALPAFAAPRLSGSAAITALAVLLHASACTAAAGDGSSLVRRELVIEPSARMVSKDKQRGPRVAHSGKDRGHTALARRPGDITAAPLSLPDALDEGADGGARQQAMPQPVHQHGASLLAEEPPMAGCGVPACFYVSLAGRTDRRQRLEGELHRAGLHCEYVEAANASKLGIPGNEGCRRSHLAALSRLEASGAPYGLVLEDDAVWHENTSTVQDVLCRVRGGIQRHPMILLSCNGYGSDLEEPWLRRVANCQTTSAYIVRRNYIKVLRDTWSKDKPGDAIDQTWKPLQKDGSWGMTAPLLVRQGASYSDIQKGYVDYGVLLKRASRTEQ